ncbi:hypothetical protein QEN19_003635 [Hanseniaspora menglaensis]
MIRVQRSYNVLKAQLSQRTFKQSAVALNEKSNGDEWNDFIGSLSNTKKTAAVYNKPKTQNRSVSRGKNTKDFSGKPNRNLRRTTDNRKPGNTGKTFVKGTEAIKNDKPTLKAPKKQNIDVDLSIFDSEAVSGSSKAKNKRGNFAESGSQRNNRPTQRRNNTASETEFNPDKVISGHSYGVKEYRIESKQEESTRRLSYKAIKNDDKVVLGTAMKFFKAHSEYKQPEVFLNPNMLINTSRECMLNVPRMINSKEHALRDAGFEVYKKLANDYKFKNEKIAQIKKVQDWEELPEGLNLNDDSWDFIERKHMIHSVMTKGSTYEHVHQSAKDAIRNDASVKIDVGRLDSLLSGKYDQDYLSDLGISELSDFQTKFKGIYAPNVVEKLYQSSKILQTSINNSPAFINHPGRKQELFEYMSLLKPTNRILESKKMILAGHKPGKANV